MHLHLIAMDDPDGIHAIGNNTYSYIHITNDIPRLVELGMMIGW